MKRARLFLAATLMVIVAGASAFTLKAHKSGPNYYWFYATSPIVYTSDFTDPTTEAADPAFTGLGLSTSSSTGPLYLYGYDTYNTATGLPNANTSPTAFLYRKP